MCAPCSLPKPRSHLLLRLVSTLDADLTIKSSDGVLFKVHRRNLELLSEGFPGEDVKTHNEIVELTETADTLEFLFQYMYPDLHGIPFQTLASLAEAAEKYRVFPVMEVCKIYMRFVFDEIWHRFLYS
jgi:hypothetical protein